VLHLVQTLMFVRIKTPVACTRFMAVVDFPVGRSATTTSARSAGATRREPSAFGNNFTLHGRAQVSLVSSTVFPLASFLLYTRQAIYKFVSCSKIQKLIR
jgi:hypothetical protein